MIVAAGVGKAGLIAHEDDAHRRRPSTTPVWYDLHVAPYLGGCKLVEISRWQAERIAGGAGREAVLQALMLLGSILQRAVEGERIVRNPARIVRKVKRGRGARSARAHR